VTASEQRAAHSHLIGSDPQMAMLARVQGSIDPYRRPHRVPLHDGDLLEGLVFHVVGQSISEPSALAVFARLRELLGGAIGSEPLAAASAQSLRATGLSTAKARTLSQLAHTLYSGELNLTSLTTQTDAEVTERLTALPGIGPWTAEIFLLYELHRPDAFPAWEIGLRKALAALDGLDSPPSADAAVARAEGWRPYRSYAAGHLWRSLAPNRG
jgi:DNA-3-methyladenine glycosylase II